MIHVSYDLKDTVILAYGTSLSVNKAPAIHSGRRGGYQDAGEKNRAHESDNGESLNTDCCTADANAAEVLDWIATASSIPQDYLIASNSTSFGANLSLVMILIVYIVVGIEHFPSLKTLGKLATTI